MRIANPARQMKGNPHFLNSIMAIGVVVLPVCLYYVVAKQPEEQKEMVSAVREKDMAKFMPHRADAMTKVLRQAQSADKEQDARFHDMLRGGRGSQRRQTAAYTGPLAEAEKKDRNVQLRARFGLPLTEEGDDEEEEEAAARR